MPIISDVSAVVSGAGGRRLLNRRQPPRKTIAHQPMVVQQRNIEITSFVNIEWLV